MFLRRLLRVLDYAYLFFALVILSSLLWAGAGLLLMWMPLCWLAALFFPASYAVAVPLCAIYSAGVSGSIGLFWGLKRWRKHLEDEAHKAHKRAAKK